ncbi:hypothetical protein K470DRAFT_256001 [Piedraia hortae CBS 480.64]|uniref:Uncharacterized protein n=1 Tax=Piedraia hortae CBS 480.64 TaxID=1314780 RepID=A0A6A7C6Q2_9PEZI|nr:hypothetical protein K470DRAFT_256001 [Piedraia hortae CBS 480.64]
MDHESERSNPAPDGNPLVLAARHYLPKFRQQLSYIYPLQQQSGQEFFTGCSYSCSCSQASSLCICLHTHAEFYPLHQAREKRYYCAHCEQLRPQSSPTSAFEGTGSVDYRAKERNSKGRGKERQKSSLLESSIAASAYAGHLHSKSAIPPTLPTAP